MASRSLGTLTLDLIAKVGGFERGMEQAARIAQSRMRQIERLFRNTAAVIGSAFGAHELKSAIEGALKYADTLDKTASRLGVNVEFLQEYRYAAQQAGVGNEEFDAGLQRLTVTLGKARTGGKEAIEAFRRLKLDPGQFESTEQALDQTLDRLGQIGDASVRNAISVQVFGKEVGPKMAALAAQGRGEIDKLRRSARELGAVLDESTIKKAVESQDKLESLANVTKTQLSVALIDMAPVLIQFAELMTQAARGVAFLDKAVKDFLNKDSGQHLLDEIDALNKELEVRETEIAAYEQIPAWQRRLFGTDKDLEKARKRAAEIQQLIAALRRGIASLDEKPTEDAPKPKPSKGTLTGILDEDAQEKIRKAIRDYNKQVTDAANDEAKAIEGLLDKYDKQGAALRDLSADQQRLHELAVQGLITWEEYSAAIQGVEKAYGDLGAEAEETQEAFDGINVFAEQAARNLQDLTADLLSGAQSFEDFGRSIIDTLKRIAAEILAQQLLTAIFGQFTTAKGGTGFSAAFADAAVGAPRRAGGGYVAGGQTYLVGEQGPELFTPNAAGSITPNGGLTFGGGVEVNVINQAANTEASAERKRGGDGREIINVVIREVASDIEKGGSVAGAIQRVYGQRRTGRGS